MNAKRQAISIYPSLHRRVKSAARKHGLPIKGTVEVLLRYGLDKLHSGEIHLTEPAVSETETREVEA